MAAEGSRKDLQVCQMSGTVCKFACVTRASAIEALGRLGPAAISGILPAYPHHASSMLSGWLPYNERKAAQKQREGCRGRIAEGFMTGARKDRGQFHKTARGLLRGRIAEGFFQTLIWHAPAEGFSCTAEGSRKDRAGSRVLQGSSISTHVQ